jgi:prolipoprotein diacylglyceryltransferase
MQRATLVGYSLVSISVYAILIAVGIVFGFELARRD